MPSGPFFVFFGNEKLATGIPTPERLILNAAISAGFELEQVVTGKLSELKPHKAEIAVLAAFGRIIPQSILDEFPLGVINIHPSLLPLYRGPTPIEQTILDGARKTGVSIMRLTAGMDEGPIYKQKTVHIKPGESKQALTECLQLLGAELIKEFLPDIHSGKLKPRQQPHPDRATYSNKISKQDGVLNFAKAAEVLEREIRAYAEWPKSRTKLANIDVIITRAKPSNNTLKPGEVLAKDKHLFIGCAGGSLEILSLKPTGKAEMSASAFLAGYKNKL